MQSQFDIDCCAWARLRLTFNLYTFSQQCTQNNAYRQPPPRTDLAPTIFLTATVPTVEDAFLMLFRNVDRRVTNDECNLIVLNSSFKINPPVPRRLCRVTERNNQELLYHSRIAMNPVLQTAGLAQRKIIVCDEVSHGIDNILLYLRRFSRFPVYGYVLICHHRRIQYIFHEVVKRVSGALDRSLELCIGCMFLTFDLLQ